MTATIRAGLETRRPFTRADAIAAGISPKQLRGSRFRRIFHGVYIEATIPNHPLIRAQAALAIHPPTAYASHLTAARVYRVPVPKLSDEHVTVPEKTSRSQVHGVSCHVASRKPSEVVEVDGVRVSAPCVMFVELASVLDLVDLVLSVTRWPGSSSPPLNNWSSGARRAPTASRSPPAGLPATCGSGWTRRWRRGCAC